MMIKKFKNLGLKLTPQRLAILNLLEGNAKHPSAEEIYNQLKPQYPSLSLATVYNTLEILAKAGELQEIRIKADKRHFDPNPAPHGHFLCRSCQSIYDLDAGPLEIQTPLNIKGYLVEEYTLYFYGICPRCWKKSSGK
ncbi:Fur family transcriptional regulator, peroxide stress response regulator [Desulforamulus putei DSM 12395]|uniref:Fur family transcriptional regulator, peroxide stress response regulator n=1 Tax=Desulforamulus putei DSM 12395 TaxID=1121429 RepID=A0A1M4VL53_9FIRM|nr:transcriptional repressor [Desulforamulus putei]SHE69600.1 Fur family transcriptional regulator, peroxide stress response regulator [Desulforamulus putei DSM 12395]